MTNEEFDKYENQELWRGEFSGSSANTVSNPPAVFNTYLQENKKAIKAYKQLPYWVRDNPDYAKVKK